MTQPPIQMENSKGQSDNTITPQKCSLKRRLQTDLGPSVGVTIITQLVWLTGHLANPLTHCNSRVIKRTPI